MICASKGVLATKLSSVFRALADAVYPYAIKSYSQEGEDMILRRIFEGVDKGFYVDVGAFHPKRFSNTYFFYKQGWHGINIDAMPGSMNLFKIQRPRDINIEKAVSDSKRLLTYYAFNEPALNGFSQDISMQLDGHSDYKLIFKKEMQTETLEEILDQHLHEQQKINFLSVDVEGLDFAVIRSNNWSKYSPRAVLVEILESTLEGLTQNEIAIFLRQFGYAIYAKCVNTVIFTKSV
jgi:FkbM family methyltransferase